MARRSFPFEPFKGLARRRRPLSTWEQHTILGFCVAVFELLGRGNHVDLKNVKKALPALRRYERDTWKKIQKACVVCHKAITSGTGKKTENGWNVHRICAAREDL